MRHNTATWLVVVNGHIWDGRQDQGDAMDLARSIADTGHIAIFGVKVPVQSLIVYQALSVFKDESYETPEPPTRGESDETTGR